MKSQSPKKESDMSSLIELEERIERLTGPCRETDGAIALAMGWTFQKMKGDSRAYYRKPGDTEYYMRSEVPAYTGSFDAAMALVPEDMEWEAGTAKLMDIGWARVVATHDQWKSKAATPTLALCAAAIRAIDGARG